MAISQKSSAFWKTHSWMVECDYCKHQIKKLGLEPGDAAENARKEGFTTVSIRVDLPMKWACLSCSKKKTAGKGVS